VWQTITSPNEKSKGITGEVTPEGSAAADADAGVSATTTTDAAPSAGGSEKDTTTAQKARITDLIGSGALKAALADEVKNDDIRGLLADAAKAAVPDLVKAAVEEATKVLSERIAKLEKMPAPSGAYVGSAKTFAIESTGVPILERAAAADPVRVRLEAMATSTDPITRHAAQAALASV
jgi:hypothetical protein